MKTNLGGMLTPFGNPQNLYIYTKYNIDNIYFMKIMLIPFVVAIVLLYLSSLFIKDVYFTTLFSCQFMSNVPTSILLSKFTNNFIPLLYGVNIGGLGTLIASLASLITFRNYTSLNPKKTGQYLVLFTFINIIFIVIESVAILLLIH